MTIFILRIQVSAKGVALERYKVPGLLASLGMYCKFKMIHGRSNRPLDEKWE